MSRPLFRLLAALFALALLASACGADDEPAIGDRGVEAPTPSPTAVLALPPTPTEGVAPTPEPETPPEATQVPPATAVPAPAATPQPSGPCDAGPLAPPDPDRPRYQAAVSIDPTTGLVRGDWSVAFTPDADIDRIVIRLWPNGPRPATGGSAMQISGLTIDDMPVDFIAEAPTLITVALPSPTRAGETLSIAADFELEVPGEISSRISRREDYMRLGSFLPLLPWEPGLGWATDPATPLFAEAVTSPVADYAVAIRVPDGFDVLASGIPDDAGVWRVDAARDFAASVGRFSIVSAVAAAPEPVRVTVGVHETLSDDPNAYLAKIVASLESFSGRWGQYPWPSLTFALTPALGGGIEFPTHIMQGPNTLGRTTSHEVGHMFFYSLVGNNQAVAPWLDEGITSYAEFTYEGTQPGAYVIPADGVGHATEPMTFWQSRSDIYYRSVYSQTGFALQRLGPLADVDCALAHYVAANAHRIATADDFVEAFQPFFPDVVNQLAAMGVVIGN